MSLNNIKNLQKERGFTIVELLIVIVVIGILAAITIVAYNGVQTRANNAAAQSAGETITKKAEAFNAIKNSYPTSTADFNSVPDSSLTGSGLTLGTPSGATGKTTVQYSSCATPSGYSVATWNFSTGALNAVTYGGGATSTSTCTVAV